MSISVDHGLLNDSVDEDDEAAFAELKRQILLLTADDDSEYDRTKIRQLNPISSKKLTNGSAIAMQPGSYFGCWENEDRRLVPAWPVNLWRNGNGGTGVFIPHIVKHRRSHSHGSKPAGGKKNGRRRM